MNGSLTLLDDNLLYIAFSIIGISSKNEQEMKFRGRGGGPIAQSLTEPKKGKALKQKTRSNNTYDGKSDYDLI